MPGALLKSHAVKPETRFRSTSATMFFQKFNFKNRTLLDASQCNFANEDNITNTKNREEKDIKASS